MWGLIFLIGRLTGGGAPTTQSPDLGNWSKLGFAVELCIPEEKQQVWKDYCDTDSAAIWLETITAIFGAIASHTLTLVIGFLLHLATA